MGGASPCGMCASVAEASSALVVGSGVSVLHSKGGVVSITSTGGELCEGQELEGAGVLQGGACVSRPVMQRHTKLCRKLF